MKLGFEQKGILGLATLSVVYWVFAAVVSHNAASSWGFYTQIPLCVIPLLAGIIGLFKSAGWGGFKSRVGTAVLLCSMALMLFGIGMTIWTSMIVAGMTLPYPSYADYIIVACMACWIVGLLVLGSVIGMTDDLRRFRGRVKAALILGLSLGIGYVVQVVVTGKDIPTYLQASSYGVFDVIYNFLNLIIIAIVAVAYVLSKRYLGGRYKSAILWIFGGMVVHYFGVIYFMHAVNTMTYFNGHLADLCYLVGLSLEGLGVISISAQLE
jgi:hypothetical protein